MKIIILLLLKHVEVAESLLASPVKLLPVLDTGLHCAASKLLEEVGRDKEGLSIKANIHARITGLPTCPELFRHAVPRTCDVGRLLCVSGTVVRTTAAKMLEYQKEFICTKCRHVFTVKSDHDQYYQLNKPNRCPNPGECYSNNFNPLGVSSHPLHTKDYQEIKIQEQVQKLVVGTIPRSLWVTLEDDLVDSCKPGDDVLICGTVHRRWRPVMRDSRPDIELVLKANNITVRNKQRSSTVVTDEIREEFAEFWEQHKYNPLSGRNIVLASFCPQVYGLYVVKLAVAVVVSGGVQKVDTSCTRIRGESHLLLVGDPGTGKSQFLKYVCKLVPRSVLTTGIGTTNAGLTVSAVRDEGEWALEAGALVLADGGICCIDEFNSVREADKAAIHEAMEQQTISVAKAGLVCKLNTRCSIFAATNPKGQYDPDESLTVNVALASPLLSRFDLILVLLDTRNPEWDKIVSGYILEGRDPLSGDGGSKEDWSMEKLQAYFCYIRTIQPALTPKANTILSRYYQVQRRSDQHSKARTTIRLLESLVRLSQGHARLMMRAEVLVQDAVMAVTLMEASMYGASVITGINPLHTAFPHSPEEEYKTQAKIVLQKLSLFDILSDEMTRLNEQEKLYVSWKALQPNTSVKQNTDDNKVPADTRYCLKKDFKPCVNDAQAASGIEELEDNTPWNSRSGKQQTLCQMSKKIESSSSVPDCNVPSITCMNELPCRNNISSSVKFKKGPKRKAESVAAKSLNAECTLQSQRKKVRGRKPKNAPREWPETLSVSSQSLVDKAGSDLLEDLEDFEGEAHHWNPLITKDKKAPLAKFCAERRGIENSDIEVALDSQNSSGPSLINSSPVIKESQTNLENEKVSVSIEQEGQKNTENSDEDNTDFFEINKESQDLLNGMQKFCSTEIKSNQKNKLHGESCRNFSSDILANSVSEEVKDSSEIHEICSQYQKQEELPAPCHNVRGEEICNNSVVSSSHSVSAKLKRFSFAFSNAGSSTEKTENSMHSENGQKSQSVAKDSVDIKCKALLPESHAVSGKKQHIILPFKKPSFCSNKKIENLPAFPSVQSWFGAASLSEELGDDDFDLDL
ncbi:uncharacterized protein [Panulirus ornatus]|uniref:uncharacterized protein isoform X2 n=1 Tax=Panulirus ornatus TaxID=150431 RepID=UPI003A8AA9CA